ncbi:MAG: putative beta-lactamase-inhibitor-like, PepSY-like [Cytophagaceae bacterium]|jgi:hypothetical protein|nr:putative beta-lactamase-inhibitor-like, PepSY-like [Cytophagaceae bacterium]
MKKSFLMLGLSLISLGSYATANSVFSNDIIFSIQDKTKEEISIDELPESVKQGIAKKHPGAVITTAYKWYRGDKFIGYEVIVTKEDKKDESVKFDKDGKLTKGLDN